MAKKSTKKVEETGAAPLYIRVTPAFKEIIGEEARNSYMSISAFGRMAISEYIKMKAREQNG